jgi:hypothetical protein
MDYLLLHCEVTSAIWNIFFNQLGLFWVMLRRVVDLYVCWWTAGNTWSVVVWKMVPSRLLWCL